MTKAIRYIAVLNALLLMLALAPPGAGAEAAGPDGAKEDTASYDRMMREDFETKSRINKALREAAEAVVAKSADPEAIKYLKMSGAAAAEGERHYVTGEYGFALEDITESSRLANYAIVVASDGNVSTRQDVIKDMERLGDERAHERKEKRIRSGIAEAEIFIQTAARLLEDGGEHPEARQDLYEAARLLKESRLALAAERYDSALEDLNTSYNLATKSVRRIKSASSESITFPKPRAGNVEKTLEYELKRNHTYLFLTEQYAPPPGTEGTEDPAGVVRARELSAGAEAAIKAGKKQEAISMLKESTSMLIKALNPPAGE